MATKKYKVREGYGFQHAGKDYQAGEIVEIDSEQGDAAHQLEAAHKAGRATPAAPAVEPPADPAAESPAA